MLSMFHFRCCKESLYNIHGPNFGEQNRILRQAKPTGQPRHYVHKSYKVENFIATTVDCDRSNDRFSVQIFLNIRDAMVSNG